MTDGARHDLLDDHLIGGDVELHVGKLMLYQLSYVRVVPDVGAPVYAG